MANTTNYNWETPDDTDLVKDGAAAIRTLGNSIDTTTKALNPETTLGDISYRSATSNTNTRLPIGTSGQILAVSAGVPAWINNDQGDITEVQAGTGISVASGTGPIPIVTNTVATAFDAAGDLVYGTGADTFTKLSLGTAGQVLKVNSGATAPEWGAASGSFAGCRLTKSATQTISTATVTAITFDTESFDTDAYHNNSVNTSRITIPSGKGGKYLFYGKIVYGASATVKYFQARIAKNGTLSELVEQDSQGQYQVTRQISSVLDCSVGDYIELMAYHEVGSNNTVAGAGTTTTTFSAVFLGA